MEYAKYLELVARHRPEMAAAERYIWEHPETGFREWQTSAYLADIFEKAGYTLVKAGDIPGFYADIDTGRPGPKLLILCELDALLAPGHFQAREGRAHACGHHAQCAAMVGIALALKEPGALDGLSGSIRLMAVPAEEGIELDFRRDLRRQGLIHSPTGKEEFLYRGYMDGVELAYMFHTGPSDGPKFACNRGSNGLVMKTARYAGTAAHAGGAPHMGRNALYAATLGLQGINDLRETFQDDEHIRIHPIITAGGESVNIIPANVQIDTFVRGASMESVMRANEKVNRALAAGALAMGATVKVSDMLGYAPLNNSAELMAVAKDCMETLLGAEEVQIDDGWGCGSTDMGNLSCVMPCMHPHIGGAVGKSHGDDYAIGDFDTACVVSAQGQVVLAAELLCNGAQKARRVVESYKPLYAGREAYFRAVDALCADRELIAYEGASARVQF